MEKEWYEPFPTFIVTSLQLSWGSLCSMVKGNRSHKILAGISVIYTHALEV